MVSSKKSDFGDNRKPEIITAWPPTPEILVSPKVW